MATAKAARRLKVFYNDVFTVELPPNHRFPMKKYAMAREDLMDRLRHADPSPSQPDVADGTTFSIGVADFALSPMATRDDLLTTHCPMYISRYEKAELSDDELRRVGFPWSNQGVKRTFSSAGGTVAATRALFEEGYTVSAHMAGGTHHAFYDRGEGYCVFNDIAVAANVAVRDYASSRPCRVLVVDLDVHQGNGTAALFRDSRDVVTFSMHCDQNLFSRREQSHYDVDVPAHTSDAAMRARMAKTSLDTHFDTASPAPERRRTWPPLTPADIAYLSALSRKLDAIFAEAAATGHPFDLVFYQAGVDPHIDDKLGRLALTRAGLRARNEMVFQKAVTEQGCKLCITMGGGYPKSMDTASLLFRNLAALHADVYWQAAEFCRREVTSAGFA